MLRFGDILPETAASDSYDQFLEGAYHRCPEHEPDMGSRLRGHLFISPLRLQTLTANDLVCAQQHCCISLSNIM